MKCSDLTQLGWTMAATLVLAMSTAVTAEIGFVGIVGNSGEAGATLVRHGASPIWRGQARGWSSRNNGSGVVQDRHGYLWARAGLDQLNRYAVDGRLLATFPLPKLSGLFWTTRIAIVDDTVVIHEDGKVQVLSMDAPSGTEPRQLDGDDWQIGWHGRDGRLPAMRGERLFWLDPQTGETEDICTLAINGGDATLELLPGGEIVCLDREGNFRVVDGEPQPLDGHIPHWSLFIDGYWYEFAWHATIRRYAPDFRADPGVVLGGNSGSFIGRVHELGEVAHPTGLVKLDGDLFAMSGFGAPLYLLHWRGDLQRFEAVRRIGGLSRVRVLALDAAGTITIQSGYWHWDDEPDAVLGDGGAISAAASQAVVMPNGTLVGAAYKHGSPGFFLKKPNDYFSNSRLSEEQAPLPDTELMWGAAWYRHHEGKGRRGVLLVLDPTGEAQSFYFNPEARNAHSAFSGHAGPVQLKTTERVDRWGSLAMVDEQTLLAAADGQVIAFARDGTDWKETGRFGGRPGDPFGPSIEITCHNGRLWVADTQRHRVQCFDARTREFIGQFGKTDQSGDSIRKLDQPTVIAANDDRCVVFDSHNFRLIKLQL